MLNTANINTNTTARTETARIDREAIANRLPTLAEVLARPVEHIRVAAYRSDGNTPYLRRAEVREIAAPLYLECVQIGDDPRPWYRIHVCMECGIAQPINICFCDYDGTHSSVSSDCENRFHFLCEHIAKNGFLSQSEYVQHVETILTDLETRDFIGKADILLTSEICKTDSSFDAALPARMAEYRTRRQERLKAQQAAAEAEERAEEEARRKTEQEAHEKEKRAIIRQLLQGGERIGAEYAHKSGTERDTFARLLAEIAQDCGVTIPVKVKGWMFKSLAALNIKGGECESVLLWKNGGTHSTTIYKYINLLLQALASESAEAEVSSVAE